MSCTTYIHNDPSGGSKYISGTTCFGQVVYYTLTYGQSVCMDDSKPLINCDGLDIGIDCFPTTPTPTVTPLVFCYDAQILTEYMPYICPDTAEILNDVIKKLRVSIFSNYAPNPNHPSYTFTITNGTSTENLVVENGQTYAEFIWISRNYFYTGEYCDYNDFPNWSVSSTPISECVPPTPTNTPSHTATPTPTSPLNQVIYSAAYMCDASDPIKISGLTLTLTFNGNTYPYTTYSGQSTTSQVCITNAPYPSPGLVYTAQINYPPNVEPCPVNNEAYNKTTFTVGEYLGEESGYPTWTGQTLYYYNDIVVSSARTDTDTVTYLPGGFDYNGCLFTLQFLDQVLGPQFPMRSVNTPTPTPTRTSTPTPTITRTPTQTTTPTNTQTPTITSTQTRTPTQTSTPTNTPSNTATNTGTPTNTPTNTATPTQTNTPTTTYYYYIVFDVDVNCNAYNGVVYRTPTNYSSSIGSGAYIYANGNFGTLKYIQTTFAQTWYVTLNSIVVASCSIPSATPTSTAAVTPAVTTTPTNTPTSTTPYYFYVVYDVDVNCNAFSGVVYRSSTDYSSSITTGKYTYINGNFSTLKYIETTFGQAYTGTLNSLVITSCVVPSATPTSTAAVTPPVTPTSTSTSTPASTPTMTQTPFPKFLLNSTAGLSNGVAACADYAAFNRTFFYSSVANGGSIVSGTYLYTTLGGIGNPTFYIPDGYYSDGTKYWFFQNGTTGDNGTACIASSATPTQTSTPTSTPASTPGGTPTPTQTSTPAPVLTEFTISDTNYGSDTSACASTSYTSAWSNGATSPPVFGDIIYANAGGTVLLNSGYYKVPDSFPAEAWIRLDGSSQVIENGLC
jgi:hypothetical protein